MIFMKYVLSKTGLFPKWQPQVSDVLKVALDSYEIKHIKTRHGAHYFYVIPSYSDRRLVADLVRTFRANGVILHAHYSKHYGMKVYRVRDRGQQFMRDAVKVSYNAGEFPGIMEKRLAERANKRYILRELFGKYEK